MECEGQHAAMKAQLQASVHAQEVETAKARDMSEEVNIALVDSELVARRPRTLVSAAEFSLSSI